MIRFSLILVYICFAAVTADFLLVHKGTGKVLDGNEYSVKIDFINPQKIQGQLWRTTTSNQLTNGEVFVANAKTNNVLDIQKGCHGTNIITYSSNRNKNQQWTYNATTGYMSSMCGNDLILSKENNSTNVIVKQKSDDKGCPFTSENDLFYKINIVAF